MAPFNYFALFLAASMHQRFTFMMFIRSGISSCYLIMFIGGYLLEHLACFNATFRRLHLA